MLDLVPVVQDEVYWAKYYESRAAPEEPSLFARHVMKKHAKPGHSLMELGCGNGRDARYFSANGVEVLAIDLCESEIEDLIESNGRHKNLHYASGDFTNMPDGKKKFDLIYSRFTLHAVNAEGQQSTLEWSYRNLAKNGKLCIEARGQKNELYKKGTPVEGEEDAYIHDNHYRRFVAFEDIKNDLTRIGFKIVESAEQTGFAPFEYTDYHFIRIIAQK